MKIAVLGAPGFGGSNVCVELLNRGHQVTGISRSPEKLGKHDRYNPKPLDLQNASIAKLVEAFKGFDVIVNAYNPPSGPDLYSKFTHTLMSPNERTIAERYPESFLETVRKILIAVKSSKPQPYFIVIGGTGSLELGRSQPYETVADSREFWLAYRRAVADSEAATAHMEERIGGGPMAEGMRKYRNARIALHAGKASDADRQAIKEAEEPVVSGPNPLPDLPLAARASFLMFEGNESFRWSFVSPSGQYRPGPRTGKYEVIRDTVPLAPESAGDSKSENQYEGRLLGISAADLGVAIADEAEKQEKVGWHWSAFAELPSDEAMSSYARI